MHVHTHSVLDIIYELIIRILFVAYTLVKCHSQSFSLFSSTSHSSNSSIFNFYYLHSKKVNFKILLRARCGDVVMVWSVWPNNNEIDISEKIIRDFLLLGQKWKMRWSFFKDHFRFFFVDDLEFFSLTSESTQRREKKNQFQGQSIFSTLAQKEFYQKIVHSSQHFLLLSDVARGHNKIVFKTRISSVESAMTSLK